MICSIEIHKYHRRPRRPRHQARAVVAEPQRRYPLHAAIICLILRNEFRPQHRTEHTQTSFPALLSFWIKYPSTFWQLGRKRPVSSSKTIPWHTARPVVAEPCPLHAIVSPRIVQTRIVVPWFAIHNSRGFFIEEKGQVSNWWSPTRIFPAFDKSCYVHIIHDIPHDRVRPFHLKSSCHIQLH